MKEALQPRFAASGIGSLPHLEPKRAARMVLENIPQAPFFPQLSRRHTNEEMCHQVLERMPAVARDETRKRYFFDTTRDFSSGLEKFYEAYLGDDAEYFAMSAEYASGFLAMCHELASQPKQSRKHLKSQIGGPLTLGFSLTDEKDVGIIHNPVLAEALMKCLESKARWQIARMKEFCSEPILFFDEPYLASLGSVFFNLSNQEVSARLNEVIEPMRKAGAWVGVHCCSNTDWSILLNSKADIVSFDAFAYFDRMACYPEDISRFLDRGGVLAWGIVPTTDFSGTETASDLVGKLEGEIAALVTKGISREKLLAQSMVTPACGLSLMTEQEAEQALALTAGVAATMQQRCWPMAK